MFITHGLSGSGKTTISSALLENLGTLRIRSDLERKRMQNLAATAKTGSAIGAGLYTAVRSDQTYSRLQQLAALILEAGYSVIVDATFLQSSRRRDFRQLAENCKVPFIILDCQASNEILADRIQKRRQSGTDASEADLKVLEHQLRTQQVLEKEEQQFCVTIATDKPLEIDGLLSAISSKIGH